MELHYRPLVGGSETGAPVNQSENFKQPFHDQRGDRHGNIESDQQEGRHFEPIILAIDVESRYVERQLGWPACCLTEGCYPAGRRSPREVEIRWRPASTVCAQVSSAGVNSTIAAAACPANLASRPEAALKDAEDRRS
jgi:hypothetical protein